MQHSCCAVLFHAVVHGQSVAADTLVDLLSSFIGSAANIDKASKATTTGAMKDFTDGEMCDKQGNNP